MKSNLPPEAQKFIREASDFLENPGIFMRVANHVGQPLEFLQRQLPDKARDAISVATHKSLEHALKIALKTTSDQRGSRNFKAAQETVVKKHRLHSAGVALAGGIGGFFGLLSLPVELPLTTAIILRSIAETAKSFGADVNSPKIQLECLYVFTLGSPATTADDASETTYYASRIGLASMIDKAASFIAKHSALEVFAAIKKGTAPVLVKFIARVASKFGIAVTEKVISEAIPIIGAAGGAIINTTFCHYFNEAAKYHFGLKKLERDFGENPVRKLYSHYSKAPKALPKN